MKNNQKLKGKRVQKKLIKMYQKKLIIMQWKVRKNVVQQSKYCDF